jgi:hypothetical protein
MVGTRPTVPWRERRAALRSEREEIVFIERLSSKICLYNQPLEGLDRLEILFYTLSTKQTKEI